MAIIKREFVDFESHARPGTRHTHTSERGPTKNARLIEVGGVVRGVEFTCACGERSVIEIEYDRDSSAPHER